MARIRTLKPQFWDSPSTAKADLACRLLFMAMWNWADDSGRGTANLKELEAFAFPNDDITQLPRRSSRNSAALWPNFAELFWETVQTYEVTLYTVSGRRYYEISSFRTHQSKHFNPDSSLPGPDDGQIWDFASEYGLNQLDQQPPPAEPRPHSSRNSAISCRDLPLDRDRDRDRDRDKEPPYPPHDEPSPARPPARQTGAEKARAKIAQLPARSIGAYRIAEAFSASLPTPIEDELLSGIGVQIDKCLKRGIPPPAIAAGLKAWTDSDSWSPTQIPNFVHKSSNRSTTNGKPTAKAIDYDHALTELLQEVETL